MRFALPVLLSVIAAPVFAHELWLEPRAFQIPADGRLEVRIVNGQEFEGSELVYLPPRIVRFDRINSDGVTPVTGRAGDRPAATMDASDGLQVMVYQSIPTLLTYEDWAKFERFLHHKDLPVTRAEHDARGLPETDFKELYTRYSRTLIGAGSGAGTDAPAGLEVELVAQDNPYTDTLSDGFHALLMRDGASVPDHQVEVFDRAPDGTVTIDRLRTDEDGIVTVPVTAGHDYMLDAVFLRIPDDATLASTGAAYETLWANLTFAVPE